MHKPLNTILLAALLATLAGCGSNPAAGGAEASNATTSEEDWFCEMAMDGDGWDCERSAARAANPNPARLPEPPALEPPPADLPRLSRRAPPAPPPTTTPPSQTFPEPTSAPQPTPQAAVSTDAPAYVRLAYRPSQPTALTELPEDFWAVQLIAFESRAALENYVQDKQLSGMSAALIARDDQPFYVLLMGVYETEALAREAAASLPEQLLDIEPWVRKLAGLQESMLAAQALAAAQG